MKHTTYSDLRKNLATYMDQVNESHEPLLVTRSGASPVVMVPLEYMVPHRLMADVEASILRGIEELDAGKGIPAEQVFAELEARYTELSSPK